MKRYFLFFILISLMITGCDFFAEEIVFEEVTIPETVLSNTRYLMGAMVQNTDAELQWISEEGSFPEGCKGEIVEWKAPSQKGFTTIKLQANGTTYTQEVEVIKAPVTPLDCIILDDDEIMAEITLLNESKRNIKNIDVTVIAWDDNNNRIRREGGEEGDFADYKIGVEAHDLDFPPGNEQTFTWNIGNHLSEDPANIQAYVSTLTFEDDSTWKAGKERIEGKIVINGEVVDFNMFVQFSTIGREHVIKVRSSKEGYYHIDSAYYVPGESYELMLLTDIFETEEIVEKGFVTFTGISSFQAKEGTMELPALDLYAYNFQFLSPQDGEKVELPYDIKINHYERTDEDREYWLYFVDENYDYIGVSAGSFIAEEFTFTGELVDGKLEESCKWYINCDYSIEGYSFFANFLGHYVELENPDQ